MEGLLDLQFLGPPRLVYEIKYIQTQQVTQFDRRCLLFFTKRTRPLLLRVVRNSVRTKAGVTREGGIAFGNEGTGQFW